MRLVAPFLDRQGSPISFKKFCSLHSDPNYVLVGYTAGEGWQVMTTWTGLGLVDEPWETSHLFQLVALHDSGGAVAWFASEADALDGHRLCAQY
ncbi:MAG TPA: hypothetical protein VM328_08065, partial [Fimbriimonadaceae bacterium]|nr:hypothetical protein [Fimbriimonadaceae bacterium]